ncbi:Octicosapeptide/Phox/Bem1p family protein [Perilla frutescens var. frutescens]|nr:Octicosapeptide/Phox/Bem1p family protein [Perilla frutescens var. frutescens]
MAMGESSLPSHNLTPHPIKFLCSYGGRILPRNTDGKLRYHGGDTRVLSVESSISFSELLVKMGEMCGSPVSLRCQLPTEDLDALVSITSDEDLANLIEEYDRVAEAPSSSFKIRAFLSAPKTTKKVSPPPSAASFSSQASTPKSPFTLYSVGGGILPRCPTSASRPYKRLSSRPPAYPVIRQKVSGKIPHQLVYHYHIGQGNGYGVGRLIHNGNHWQ